MAGWIASPSQKYGGSLATPTPRATSDATATTTIAPTPTPSLGGMTDPGDPFFWFAVVAALGVGLMAYSTVVPA